MHTTTTPDPLPLFLYPPLAAVDAACLQCQLTYDGLLDTLLVPADSSDRFMVDKLHYYCFELSAASLEDLLVPTLRHIAVATALASRHHLYYPLPHHALQRLFALMTERVLTHRHRDASWPQRAIDDHLGQAGRHLDRLAHRVEQPAPHLHALDQVRVDAADAANYLAFAFYRRLRPVDPPF